MATLEQTDVKTNAFYNALDKSDGFPLESLNRGPQMVPSFVPIYSSWIKAEKQDNTRPQQAESAQKLPSINTVQQYLHEAMTSKADQQPSEQPPLHDLGARGSWPRKTAHAERLAVGARSPGARSTGMLTGPTSGRGTWPSGQASPGVITPPQRGWMTPPQSSSNLAPGTAPAATTTTTSSEFAPGSFDMDAAQRVMTRMKALEEFVRTKVGNTSAPSAETIDVLTRRVDALQEQVAMHAETSMHCLADSEARVHQEAAAAKAEAKAAKEEARAARAALGKIMSMLSKLEATSAAHTSQLDDVVKVVPQHAGRTDALQTRLDRAEAALTQQATALVAAQRDQDANAKQSLIENQTQMQATVQSVKVDMDKKIKGLEEELQALRTQMAISTETQASLLQSTAPDLDAVKARLDTVESGLTAHQEVHSTSMAENVQLVAGIASRVDEQQSKLAELSDKHNSLSAQLEAVQGAVAQATTVVQDVRAKVDSRPSAPLDEFNGRMSITMERLDAVDIKVTAVTERVQVIENSSQAAVQSAGQIAQLQDKVAAMVQGMEGMKERVAATSAESDAKIASLGSTIQAASQSLDRLAVVEEKATEAMQAFGRLADVDQKAAAAVERLGGLEASWKTTSQAVEALSTNMAVASQCLERMDGLDAKGEAAAQQLQALDQKIAGAVQSVLALEEKSTAAVTLAASVAGAEGDSLQPPQLAKLTEQLAALETDVHGRVSELQQKLSDLLQILVQRVKTLEGTVTQLANASEQQAGLSSSDGNDTAAVLAVKQQVESMAGDISMLQQSLATLQGQVASEQLQHLQARIEEAEKLHAAAMPGNMAERLDAAEAASEGLRKALQQLSERVAAAEVMALEVQAATAGAVAAPAATEAAAGLNTKLASLHEEAMADIDDLRQKVTPVLQLLVKKVKELESAQPGPGTAVSEDGVKELSRNQSPEAQDLAAEVTHRLQQHEEATSERINALQAKVSSVLQLLVTRVKTLEAKAAVVHGGPERGNSPSTASLTGGLESVPE